MTPKLSDEQLQALDANGGRPVPVEDPRTHKTYVLVAWDIAKVWMDTPDPTASAWSEEKNALRCSLIEKKYAGGITPDEEAELEQLQEDAGQYRERFSPMAADTVRALEEELRRLRQEHEGNGASA